MNKSYSPPDRSSDNNGPRERLEDACDLTLLARALDCLSEMVLITDSDGRIVYANPAIENTLGYTPEDVIGRESSEFFADIPGNPPDLIEEIRREGKDGVWKKEIFNRKKDGTLIRVSLTLNQLRDGDGQPLGTIGITRDITQRRKDEQALRRAKEETDRINRELEEAIKRANRLALEAEMANRAKSEFLANMSHEIRTPMNGVIGMTGLLLETELNEEQRDYLEIIQTSGNALLQIINNILDLSKIEAGKLDLNIIGFELRGVIEEVIDMVTPRAREKGLELTHLVDPDLPAIVKGDPVRLRQILLNLANNAVKFTPDGEVSIQAEKAEESAGELTVRFTVTDTGVGIPPGGEKELFESFIQGDSSSTRQYGGSGLGLAIARELAGMMGGEIGVKSRQNRGSVFWFTAVFATQSGEEDREKIPDISLIGRKILVVDDSAGSRRTIFSLLKERGGEGREAESGEAALVRLRRAKTDTKPFDLVIVDMKLPDLSGEELAAAIKADPGTGEPLLIALFSSAPSGAQKDRLRKIGYTAFLTKPVKKNRLFSGLAEALGSTAESVETSIEKTEPAAEETRKLNILVAEDNPVNQKVALRILEKLGHRAEVAGGGKEALKILEGKDFDLVLMDIQMPGMDGFETTRIIRQREADNPSERSGDPDLRSGLPTLHSPLPIIAMTAHAMEGDREKCLEAGMNDYIPKPVKPVHIENAIHKLFPRAPLKRGKGAVLVVDDEERICSFCRRELEEAGYLVREARDGRDGLKIQRQNPSDIILLDLAMPGMDGAETLGHIRDGWPELPVIIITAYGDSELMLRALEYSPFMVLNKPFSREDLLAVVKNNINTTKNPDVPTEVKRHA